MGNKNYLVVLSLLFCCVYVEYFSLEKCKLISKNLTGRSTYVEEAFRLLYVAMQQSATDHAAGIII